MVGVLFFCFLFCVVPAHAMSEDGKKEWSLPCALEVRLHSGDQVSLGSVLYYMSMLDRRGIAECLDWRNSEMQRLPARTILDSAFLVQEVGPMWVLNPIKKQSIEQMTPYQRYVVREIDRIADELTRSLNDIFSEPE